MVYVVSDYKRQCTYRYMAPRNHFDGYSVMTMMSKAYTQRPIT